ncbi:MAG: hypothetical protein MUP69_10450 [Candidatus Atribacteria bacterium]|nr:hypothetical protein [Candidatus Atribacteria bacterium]
MDIDSGLIKGRVSPETLARMKERNWINKLYIESYPFIENMRKAVLAQIDIMEVLKNYGDKQADIDEKAKKRIMDDNMYNLKMGS